MAKFCPYIDVQCDRIQNVIGSEVLRFDPSERKRRYGRAMATRVAQSFYHVSEKRRNTRCTVLPNEPTKRKTCSLMALRSRRRRFRIFTAGLRARNPLLPPWAEANHILILVPVEPNDTGTRRSQCIRVPRACLPLPAAS